VAQKGRRIIFLIMVIIWHFLIAFDMMF